MEAGAALYFHEGCELWGVKTKEKREGEVFLKLFLSQFNGSSEELACLKAMAQIYERELDLRY